MKMATGFYNIRSRRLLTLHYSGIRHHLSQNKHPVPADLLPFRCITTTPLKNIEATVTRLSWVDKIKGVFTGQKPEDSQPAGAASSVTLENYADELKKARKLGSLAQFVRGRSSEATMSDAFEKQEAIIRALASHDSSGERLEAKHKAEAAKLCSCTIADVENALAKFTWAKEANKKMEKLKEQGKPMPKSLEEVQQLVGSTPMGIANTNLAKTGQISRNADCPCGSKKKYKRCCGKT
jgi:hypothetical protein